MKIKIPEHHPLVAHLKEQGVVPDSNGYYDLPVYEEKDKLKPYEKELELIQEVFGKRWRLVTDKTRMGDFDEVYLGRLRLKFPKINIDARQYLWQVAEEIRQKYGDVMESIWREEKQ